MKTVSLFMGVVFGAILGFGSAFAQDGWDDTGDQVILENIGDKVGIGTPAPAEKLTVGNGAILLMEKWDPQPWRELLIKNRATAYSDDRPAILTGSGSAVKNSAFDYYGSLILAGRDNVNGGIYFLTGDGSGHQERMVIKPDGRIGMGTSSIPAGYKLAVDGKAIFEEVQVQLSENWPDFVFEEGYQLRSIADLKTYVQEHKRLPEIPSAGEVDAQGLGLGNMQSKLLQKIEELTLYMIELKNENDGLTARVNQLEAK